MHVSGKIRECFESAFPNDVVVRIETSVDNLRVATALQKIATLEIPELVPQVYAIGKGSTASGKNFEYTVMEYVSNTEVLETVWPDLPDIEKSRLAGEVVQAVKRLQKVRFDDARVQDLFEKAPYQINDELKAIGGPRNGYFQSLYDFLHKFVADHQMKTAIISTIEHTTEGIKITSVQDQSTSFTFSHAGLAIISATTALSHNDLEPRNILVRRLPSNDADSEPDYKLAAIIDWEMAGFMPFVFESAWKDGGLGSSSVFSDWYQSFKQQTHGLVPRDNCFQRLLSALHMVIELKRESMSRNVNAEVCRRWRAREGIEWAADFGGTVMEGWTVKRPRKFSKEVLEEIEMQVLRDFGML
ncbi:hypothetical protein E8E13_007505 [Curvularia kusanoi]|uniref:Aminoglycoside phosphotransferase domain-containing protein n=1 Tax=Curvularia kusanoi TaxID=90978 RepID=A0A9P4W9H6_CURKU|nr:hypothetical protein E8E13_007505 [Curvularia kusanoi]